MRIGTLLRIFLVNLFSTIFLTWFYTFVANSNFIDPSLGIGFLWISFCYHTLLVVLLFLPSQKKIMQTVINGMKKSLKYCNKCGMALNTTELQQCPHCKYKFPFDELEAIL